MARLSYRAEASRLSASDPATDGVAIDYSGGDQTLDTYSRAIYIGTAGHLKVDMVDGTTLTFSNLAAGQVYAFAVKKVYQTGSTAAGVLIW